MFERVARNILAIARKTKDLKTQSHGCAGQNQRDPILVGSHFRTYFSGDWDVHWGCDLDFDPWPHGGPPEPEMECPFVAMREPMNQRLQPCQPGVCPDY